MKSWIGIFLLLFVLATEVKATDLTVQLTPAPKSAGDSQNKIYFSK